MNKLMFSSILLATLTLTFHLVIGFSSPTAEKRLYQVKWINTIHKERSGISTPMPKSLAEHFVEKLQKKDYNISYTIVPSVD